MLVALKVCRRALVPHFLDSYAPGAQLDHPNIIRRLGFGEFEHHVYFALEFVEGKTLADRLLEGALPEVHVARIAHGVSSALQYAWDRGLIAVNLTPEAVLLDQEFVPRLTDFHPMRTFTPSHINPPPSPFLAPEQLHLQVMSPATDVYRVGALMYAMLTGAPPFPADANGDFVRQVLTTDPRSPRQVNPTVGRALDAVCMACLAKLVDARPASLRELSNRLEPFLGVANPS